MASSHYIVMRNGKRVVSPAGQARAAPYVWTATEVRRLHNKPGCFVVANTKTQKTRRVGRSCSANLGAMPSWWPFKSKKKQLDRDPRRMAQTIMFVPGAKGMSSRGELVTMRGAKRRKQRRR